MCLILLAYHVHPTYKLIVAANRDESYHRPTADADYWDDMPHILAGRDLKKMGTWMGVTKTGRFAALTNYRDPLETREGKYSRGDLVADYLKGTDSAELFIQNVAKDRVLYPGFNLLTGTLNALFYYSNIENKIHKVQPGIHGLSNHLLNTDWPKVKQGKEGLARIINDQTDHSAESEKMVEQLFGLLKNADPAPDELLPNTGISRDLERTLSPLFIKSEGYGTRCSTILMMGDKDIHYVERQYSKEGINDREFLITI